MNLIEFIGFVSTIIAMFVILIRRSMIERRRKENPELYQQEEEDKEHALREFLHSMNIEVEDKQVYEEPAPPPPPPEEKPIPKKPDRPKRLVRDTFELERRIEKYEKTRGVESRSLEETEVGKIEFRELGQEIVTDDLFLDTGIGAYEIDQKREEPRVRKMLENLKHPSDMVIYHEVLGKPKALQRHTLSHDLAE